MSKLTATQKSMLKKHSKKQSPKHMSAMSNMMRSGKSFEEAHKTAMKKGGA